MVLLQASTIWAATCRPGNLSVVTCCRLVVDSSCCAAQRKPPLSCNQTPNDCVICPSDSPVVPASNRILIDPPAVTISQPFEVYDSIAVFPEIVGRPDSGFDFAPPTLVSLRCMMTT